jgi:hypothetical protein
MITILPRVLALSAVLSLYRRSIRIQRRAMRAISVDFEQRETRSWSGIGAGESLKGDC